MNDDVKMALICLGMPILLLVATAVYFAFQDWLLADTAKKAIEAQKEIWLNMPEKCKDCPYCRLKEEKRNEGH